MALAPAALAQVADADKAVDLDTILVTGDSAQTGTKTNTKLIETPQSISVVSAEDFTERTVQSFQDAFRYSAGVSTESQGLDVRGDFFSSRGFDVAQYLDGLNRMPDFIYGARLDPYTLERAEVLRGPSSVLYGAGSAGGVFNAISKRPQDVFGGEVALTVGNDSLKEFQADVTGPLTDSISGRMVVVARDGELQWGHEQSNDRVLINPSLSWHNADETTTVTLIGMYQKDRNGVMSYALLPEQMKALGLDYDTFFGDTGFNRMDTDYKSASLLIDHAFNNQVSFNSHTRYYEQDVDYHETYIDVSDIWEPAFRDYPADTLLQREWYALAGNYKGLASDNNVTFAFDTGPLQHKVLAGLDYTKFKLRTREGYSCDYYEGWGCWGSIGDPVGSGGPPPLDLTSPDYDAGFAWGYLDSAATNIHTESTNVGLYLQDQLDIGSRVNVVAGLRRDKVKTDTNGANTLDQSKVTKRLGVIVDAGAGFSPYLSYAESFLPIVDVDYYGNPYKPREAQQYEAGVKWQPNRTTLVTLAAFKIDETNRTVADPNNLQNFIQIGQVQSKGLELEAKARVWGLNIDAAWSYLDATIENATDGTSGHNVSNVPRHLASLWASKDFWFGDDWKLRVGVGARYVGHKQWVAALDYPDYGLSGVYTYRIPDVTLFDAVVQLDHGNWTYSLNSSNLADKEYMSQCSMYAPNYASGGCYVGTARIVTASVRYRF